MIIAEEYPASTEIIALYYLLLYNLLCHVQGSTRVTSPFNQWGLICWLVQGVHFLPWGPLSRRPTGSTALPDQSCFQTSCLQNLKNTISPLMALTFFVVVASTNAPGLCIYMFPCSSQSTSFLPGQAIHSAGKALNQSFSKALILGLGV